MEMIFAMTIQEFEERAMAYGAQIDIWPEQDRAAARELLAGSSAARETLEEARALDAMLDLWEGPQPSEALLGRVLADAAAVASGAQDAASAPKVAPAREGLFARLFGNAPVFRPGLALAACLALGVVMGTNIEESLIDPAPVETVQDIGVIDFAFAMEDDADLLLGPEALL